MAPDRAAPRDPGKAWKAAAAYGLAAFLAFLLVSWIVHLWEADLSVPFLYAGDALLNLVWVKTLIEHGWYLHNDAIGAPGGVDMHDFPLVDSLFFALLKLISLAGCNPGRTINLYYLMTYPLTALTGLAALRRLGVSYGPALVAALLYAFLPYHFYRGQGHLFLASYYLIPPMVVLLLRVGLFCDAPAMGEDRRGRIGPGAVALCLLMGCGGVYYAFFSCYLLLVAGVAAGLSRRRLGPAVRAALLIGIITAAVLANLAPKFLYDQGHGPNPVAAHRHPVESEVYGLRISQLLAPIYHHRLGVLSRLRVELERVLPSLHQFEGPFPALGAAGAVGFLLLLGLLLVRRAPARQGALHGLALLNLAAVLLAIVGGLGTVFALLVSPMIRCYNRISIFIACFALFALALLAQALLARLTRPRHRLAFHAALGLVLVGGILDQTTPTLTLFIPNYSYQKRLFDTDAEFVGRIEAALPPRAMVFQLPPIDFPEPLGPFYAMDGYDHFRCYLHSKSLRWSYGAMKGRGGDRWRVWVGEKPLEEMVPTLARAGFAGIHVNRSAYPDRGVDLEASLARILGTGPRVTSRDGINSFFGLADYTERLRGRSTATEWAEQQEWARNPVIVLWGFGFYPETVEPAYSYRWSEGRSELFLVNPGARPCRVTLALRCIAGAPEPETLRIRGPAGWREQMTIDGAGREVRRELVLPPGQTRVRFGCDGRPINVPGDPRRFVFQVTGLSVSPVSPGGPAAAVARSGNDGSGSRRE